MKKIELSQVGEVLRKMYKTDITITLVCIPDCGITYSGGNDDVIFEFPEKYPHGLNPQKIEDVVTLIANVICENLPLHPFSKWYRRL